MNGLAFSPWVHRSRVLAPVLISPSALPPFASHPAGWMFWFRRKRLPGSYLAFSLESRS